MTQQPTSSEHFREIREVVTIETRTRDLGEILSNLEQEIWFERDGFAGTLTLDIHSITSAVSGTTHHTSTATRQRTFPYLSSPDNFLIPRTIEDGGTTFQLTNVDWRTNSVSSIDGHSFASSYAAHATYSAQVTQTRTIGYTTTAEFVGTVFRNAQGMTMFTAVFYGDLIPEMWLSGSSVGGSGSGLGNWGGFDTGNSNEGGGFNNGVSDGSFANSDGVTNSNFDPNFDSDSNTTSASTQTGAPNNLGGADGNTGDASSGGADNGVMVLTIIGVLISISAIGVGGFILTKRFIGSSVTVYSINGPREIIRAGKVKIDLKSPELTIALNDTVSRSPAKTDRYIIQIAKKTTSKLVGKSLRVLLHDKEAIHKVPEQALDAPVYEFEVNFADDEDELDDHVNTPMDLGH